MLDPRPIIRGQCAVLLIYGVFCYLCPEFFWGLFLNVQMDGVHFHMARCAPSICIAMSLMFWAWSKSHDPSAYTPAIMNTILFNGFGLAATLYARAFAAEFFHSKALLIILIWFAINTVFFIYVLLKSGWHMGRIEFESDRQFYINRLFMFDCYAAMFVGFLWMGYPDLLLRRQINFPLTPHHAYICRIFGAALASTNVFGSNAMCFKNHNDRLYALYARCLSMVLVLASQFHSQYAYHQWWSHGHWVGMSLWTLWTGIVSFVLLKIYQGKWK